MTCTHIEETTDTQHPDRDETGTPDTHQDAENVASTNQSVTPPHALSDTEKADASILLPDNPVSIPDAVHSNMYYEVLSLEQDEIIHLSHLDRMSRECTVQLDRSTDDKSKSMNVDTSNSTDTASSKEKPCFRPRHKPSCARIQAKKMITACNNRIKVQELTPTLIRCDPLPVKKPVGTPVDAEEAHSKATKENTPPESPIKIRIVGLKTHRDAQIVKKKALIREELQLQMLPVWRVLSFNQTIK